MNLDNYNLISKVTSPRQLRRLGSVELVGLAAELRQYIIEVVSKIGGHLGASLGAVELTIALHYALDTPRDKLIWDVGHQAYAHKVLTGRAEKFATLRRAGGISGFPKRTESEYDVFSTGHAGNAISVALGLCQSRASLGGKRFKAVAVCGDGALGNGMSFEALNQAGVHGKNLMVVLNDNRMSIAKNVGAMSRYLNRIITDDIYIGAKREVEAILKHVPLGQPMLKLAKRIEESAKGLIVPGVIFEELGFKYFGPIDGHDINELISTLQRLKKYEYPILLHVLTKKGKGYAPAERQPESWHGVGPFCVGDGRAVKGEDDSLSYTEIFSRALLRQADRDKKIVAVTAAMPDGTGLEEFRRKYPRRFYDVGIAEGHAVTFAAGLAAGGARPVVAIYSTFLQRSLDQIIEDVCLQKLPVIFAVDRAGLVGEDGETHQGVLDISYLSLVPDLTVLAPSCARELEMMLAWAVKQSGPVAIRYPRGTASESKWKIAPIKAGRGVLRREGKDVLIVAVGSMVDTSMEVAEELSTAGRSCAVFDARFVKPFDQETILKLAAKTKLVVTVEENSAQGSLGSELSKLLHAKRIKAKFLPIALPDQFIEHGTPQELKHKYGLDALGVFAAIREVIKG